MTDTDQEREETYSEEETVARREAAYPDATHAFDRDEPEITVNDPIAHLGAGGEVVFRYNAEAAAQARAAVVAFFARTL